MVSGRGSSGIWLAWSLSVYDGVLPFIAAVPCWLGKLSKSSGAAIVRIVRLTSEHQKTIVRKIREHLGEDASVCVRLTVWLPHG